MFFPTKSLINAKILTFYNTIECEELKNVSEFFQANGAFNSKKVLDHLLLGSKCDDIMEVLNDYKYEDYLIFFKKLLPIFHHTTKIYNIIKENSDHALKIQWMGTNVEAYLSIESAYKDNRTETFEHILILTSLLANAMTNVYLSQTKARHAPHLLKDIINSPQIKEAFGLEMVIILKILLGSPNSINLRNILWHGFPNPMEIPSYYVNVLLITIHSLGFIIETKGIQTNNRHQITSFSEHLNLIQQDYQLKPINLTYIEGKLQEVNTDFKIYWQQLLIYYKAQKYKEFIILVLPQIELVLRLHYGNANNCDISAKLDEYYITIDTIFQSNVFNEDKVEEISNKLLDFEVLKFEGCFHLLYDIFLSPNGCRLRDKVSHGEVCLKALDNSQLCSLILHMFFVLLFPEEFQIFENYESKLHLNTTTKKNLIKSFKKLKIFFTTYLENQEELLLLNAFAMDSKIFIFKRPRKEAELMLLINKIAKYVSNTIINYEESIKLRSALLAKRELHSKRRKTLKKLQSALPDIFRTLVLIISSIRKIFTLLQSDYSHVLENNQACAKTLRFLKHCLTLSENFFKYSHCENNEWIKSLELCRKYDEFHKKLFLYDG